MKIYKENEFTKGWFIGSFDPTLLDTKEFEVSIKRYKKGDREDRHVHKVAKEYTVIGTGKFRMNGRTVVPGDIVLLEPGESTDFLCLVSGVNFVVKTPSISGDKYFLKNE